MPQQMPVPTRTIHSRPHSQAKVQILVRSSLRSSTGSSANRRRAQDLVWSWVGNKWPRLGVSMDERGLPQLERTAPGVQLSVSTNPESNTWTLSVANSERDGTRTWMTSAMVTAQGDSDLLDVQTSCAGRPDAPLVVAPPGVLGLWVERLELEDGGVPVLGEPREVCDADQLKGFCEHVHSPERKLPIIALTSNPHSRFYGVDPHGLAQVVRGLAHVAFIAPEMAAAVESQVGADFALHAGAARIYKPGFSRSAAPQAHPLLKDPRPAGAAKTDDPGAFRRLLCRHICALSVEATAAM